MRAVPFVAPVGADFEISRHKVSRSCAPLIKTLSRHLAAFTSGAKFPNRDSFILRLNTLYNESAFAK